MMNLKNIIQQEVRRTGLAWYIVERDYVLSATLQGISLHPVLRKNLIFKGGTCLKKCYFEDYRFSEDLDFSVCNPDEIKESIDDLIKESCVLGTQFLKDQDINLSLNAHVYQESRPHPEGQKAYVIEGIMPHNTKNATAYVEITFHELIVSKPVEKKILSSFYDSFDASILAYAPE